MNARTKRFEVNAKVKVSKAKKKKSIPRVPWLGFAALFIVERKKSHVT